MQVIETTDIYLYEPNILFTVHDVLPEPDDLMNVVPETRPIPMKKQTAVIVVDKFIKTTAANSGVVFTAMINGALCTYTHNGAYTVADFSTDRPQES